MIAKRLLEFANFEGDGEFPALEMAQAVQVLYPILEAAESLHFFMTPLNEMGAKISELETLIAAAREVIPK